jgi:hypothetical protein
VLAAARERRIDRVSLSVEDGNQAKALYASEGFVFVVTSTARTQWSRRPRSPARRNETLGAMRRSAQ